jgi:hypothetical protein
MAVENENKLNEIIQAFADAGFINDVILIGSWRLSFYVEVFEGFVPSVRMSSPMVHQIMNSTADIHGFFVSRPCKLPLSL